MCDHSFSTFYAAHDVIFDEQGPSVANDSSERKTRVLCLLSLLLQLLLMFLCLTLYLWLQNIVIWADSTT